MEQTQDTLAWFLTTVLFFSTTGTFADAECHCNTTTSFAVFPSTPCSQVGDPDRCREGWFGSYCQKRNIALGRSARQSSTFTDISVLIGNTTHRYEAWYGVDGIATTNFYSKPLTCTHTNSGDQTWTVYLNNSNTDKIQQIKLYLRQGFLLRNKGMKIYVGGQLCFQWSHCTYPPAIADVECQQALTGNNLTIQTSDYLTLCEVQIFVCSDGWFGEDCDKQCHCSLNTEVCEKITGQCLGGCAPGYMGIDCQTDAECHCASETACAVFPSTPCSQVGDPDRCREGWFGSYCQKRNIALGRSARQSSTFTETSVGIVNTTHRYEAWYGVDGIATTNFYSKPLTCTHTNSGDQTWTVYLNNSNTDKIQQIKLYLRQDFLLRNKGMKIYVGGQLCFQWSHTTYPPAIADVECQQALTGNNLTIQTSDYLTLCEVQIFVCSDGWFGEDCDKQCHCSLNTEVCEKITGQCLGGCAPGYMGIDCQTACPNGYYGPNCGFQCGNCVEGDVCIKTNGTCPGGCAAGWINDRCNHPCPDGYYGTDCTSKCGNCLDKDVCNKSTGTCPNGCAAGWMNNTCHNSCAESPATSGCSNHVVPVAATLGTLLVLALIALLIAIIYIRRLKNQLNALNKKPEDNYVSLDERTKDPVVESTYEQINNTSPYVNTGDDPQGRI